MSDLNAVLSVSEDTIEDGQGEAEIEETEACEEEVQAGAGSGEKRRKDGGQDMAEKAFMDTFSFLRFEDVYANSLARCLGREMKICQRKANRLFFAKHVAKVLDRLPAHKRALAKIKIDQVLMDIEFN